MTLDGSPLEDAYSPVYALAIITIVSLLSSLMARLVPHFRRELTVEDETRITPLDGLRGILCFGVMFCHAAVTLAYIDSKSWGSPPSPFYTLLGETSVALFFSITAFLFWTRVTIRGGRLSPWPFLRARLYRLSPLYIFSCVLALGIAARQIHWFSPSAFGGLATMALMGVRPWGVLGGTDVGQIDAGVTWSLQYEWGFYLLLPALALIVRGNDARRLWFILAGAWVMFGMGRFLFFVPGILAVYVSQIPSVVRWAKSWHASLGIICIAIALPLVTGTGFGIRALVATTLLFVPIACGNNLFGLLNLRGLRLMGIISYSVYLLHGIVLYLARPVLAQAKHQGANGVWLFWSYVLGLACITLIFCMLTYRWIESPFINIERMRRQSPRTADIVHSAAEQAAAASKDIS